MALPSLAMNLWEMLVRRSPMFIYMAAWTALITATVAVAAFSPEVAFVWAVSPSSSFARGCIGVGGAVRLPVEGPPGEVVCVPVHLFGRSKADFLIPPLFAALVVASSVCFTRAVGLWEAEDEAPLS
ncbi:uncharacterized protein LOC103711350 [Phoenix dactylifera]|uniref:Uncharacterized protein LOC103711350 n=1 Tax=Phoenix dactylifera TaxID=42345 RepID=A0A8B7CBA6_PHODC|nr:uncharacterized protein LOC103711350 [Phoenix dactylifera]